jgi:hypothetical protein
MKQYVFHTFKMGDVDDPELYASAPILEWQKTDQGQWVMKHCPDPQYSIEPDTYSWGQSVKIHGPLEERDAVIFMLKWSNSGN